MLRKERIFRIVVLLTVLMIVSVVVVAAAPLCHITMTTQVSAATIQKNQSVHDDVKITTNNYYARLHGTFAFWACGPTATVQDCKLGGTSVGQIHKDTYLNQNTTYTYPSNNLTPTQAGIYCFRVLFTPASGNEWSITGDNPHIGGPNNPDECARVVAPLTFTTSLGADRGTEPYNGTAPFPVAAGTSVKDYFVINPEATGTINGTLKSFVCQSATAQPCTSGGAQLSPDTLVPSQTLTANTVYTFTSAAYTPASSGVYCFRTEFIAGPDSIFMDTTHVGGNPDTLNECVKVGGVTAVTLTSLGASSSAERASGYLGFSIVGALAIISAGLYLARKNALAA